MNRPIIIIGMHRSGTSLIAKLLHEMGVFMGNGRSSGNAETRFFWGQPYALSHASCDNPEPENFLWQDEFQLTNLVRKIQVHGNSWQVYPYQGLVVMFRSRSLID